MTSNTVAAVPEADRLTALESFRVVDIGFEQAFTDLVALAAAICDTPMAAISFVAEDRQWFKVRVGLDIKETARGIAFCAHTIEDDRIFEVEDAATDARFSTNPLVVGNPHMRFYAGAPLIAAEGARLGALCVIDDRPRKLTDAQRSALAILSRQVQAQLELRRAVRVLAERKLAAKAQLATLQRLRDDKDRLLAFLVHDLRSPLSSIVSNAQYLEDECADESREAARDISSSARVLVERVDELLSVHRAARAQLEPELVTTDLGALLREVAHEASATVAQSHRDIEVASSVGIVLTDGKLVRRIVENLVSNAIRHTPTGGQIRIDAHALPGRLRIAVSDTGPGISAEDRERIFEPHVQLERDASVRKASNVGLGLAFCKTAVTALDGTIAVVDSMLGGATLAFELPQLVA